MDPHLDLLKSDFEQCFSQMRHYDQLFYQTVRFIYAGFAAVIAAATSIYVAYGHSTSVCQGLSLMLLFTAFAGALLLQVLLRNRVYYTLTARFVNEVRGHYLGGEPLGIKNVAGMYTDAEQPRVFSPGSTHFVLMFAQAAANASLVYAAIYLCPSQGCLAEHRASLAAGAAAFFGIGQVAWVITYAVLKQKARGASKAVLGKGG